MMKKGDIHDNAAADDEVKTRASQNCASVTLCMEEHFLRTQVLPSYQLRGMGWRRK
jgi:hypothetical protein